MNTDSGGAPNVSPPEVVEEETKKPREIRGSLESETMVFYSSV